MSSNNFCHDICFHALSLANLDTERTAITEVKNYLIQQLELEFPKY